MPWSGGSKGSLSLETRFRAKEGAGFSPLSRPSRANRRLWRLKLPWAREPQVFGVVGDGDERADVVVAALLATQQVPRTIPQRPLLLPLRRGTDARQTRDDSIALRISATGMLVDRPARRPAERRQCSAEGSRRTRNGTGAAEATRTLKSCTTTEEAAE